MSSDSKTSTSCSGLIPELILKPLHVAPRDESLSFDIADGEQLAGLAQHQRFNAFFLVTVSGSSDGVVRVARVVDDGRWSDGVATLLGPAAAAAATVSRPPPPPYRLSSYCQSTAAF